MILLTCKCVFSFLILKDSIGFKFINGSLQFCLHKSRTRTCQLSFITYSYNLKSWSLIFIVFTQFKMLVIHFSHHAGTVRSSSSTAPAPQVRCRNGASSDGIFFWGGLYQEKKPETGDPSHQRKRPLPLCHAAPGVGKQCIEYDQRALPVYDFIFHFIDKYQT